MTAFTEADLDRLADFVGGALDGTPAADDVRHLVSTEESWAEAYAMLVSADAAMRDELHALGAEALPVPLDVQQRLDAALASAVTAPPADAPVVDLNRAREARKRRRTRWTAGLAAAAAVLVCGGVGVQVLRESGATKSDRPASAVPNVAAGGPERGSATGAQGDAGPGSSGFLPFSGDSPIISSGRDYARGTVGGVAETVPKAQSHNNVQGDGGASAFDNSAKAPAAVPSPLARLAEPAARAACITAITREYGGQVALVDYAAFEGQAALVVVVDGSRTAVGRRLVIVVGPDCGLGGAIADERYRTTAP
ncbi:hypothetical protein ACQP2P_45915 [Dactylosporangium sp. CA-139114]|uniref:hypothetical protein n=1 Tax=Dactylosporangium sp. CA-139114 TaxID=3239931 RepID=UPI003D97EA28